MKRRMTTNLFIASALVVGVAIGVAGSVGGLLVSPQLAGISSGFRCRDCHQLHGAITLDNVPFNALVLLTGDVPQPGFLSVNDILPYRYAGQASVSLMGLLAENGVQDFKEVSLVSTDGGLVTIGREHVSERSLLLPYLESVRFKDDGLHVSTWLKGVNRIIVIGYELPLTIDGRSTSIGRLLRENTLTVVSERSYPMYRSEEDGEIREAEYSHLHTGAPIREVVTHPGFSTLTVIDTEGRTYSIDAQRADNAILTVYYGSVTLLLPDLHRGEWISDVVKVVSNP